MHILDSPLISLKLGFHCHVPFAVQITVRIDTGQATLGTSWTSWATLCKPGPRKLEPNSGSVVILRYRACRKVTNLYSRCAL
jgi:hypothetical protein